MTMTTKRAATRLALFLGAAAGAFAFAAGAAGTAEAQNAELLADLTGTADACMAGGGPLLAEGDAVCSAELRLRFGGGKAEVRFGAETARALPAGIASNPRGKPGCVQASPATAQEPETWNCTRPATRTASVWSS